MSSVISPETFLELVQRTALECGIAGDSPSTLVGANTELLQLAGWVNQSWMEIQQKHPDWGFMLQSPGVSFPTIAAQTLYTPTQAGVVSGVVGKWKRETFRVYLTTSGQASEVRMAYRDYDNWRDACNVGALRTSQVFPVNFSIHPNQSLAIQCPLAGYTITGDYFSAPVPMALDGDTPSLQAEYRMVIVYGAMKFYGGFYSAPEVYDRGSEQYTKAMNKLENLRLHEIWAGGALC